MSDSDGNDVGDLGGVRPAPPILVVVDALTDYRFADGPALAADGDRLLRAIRRCRDDADRRGAATVYVNDVGDGWCGDPARAVERMISSGMVSPEAVRAAAPRPRDVYLPKGRHSAFHGTALDDYLTWAECRDLVLVGQATDQCVLYTAIDAHIRRHRTTVVAEALAASDASLGAAALRMMEQNLGTRIEPRAQGTDVRDSP